MSPRKNTDRIPNPKSLANLRRGGGRPKGSTNKATAEVRALAAAYSGDAIATLAAVMNHTKADVRARIAAANALLDRAHGRPAQAITGRDGDELAMTPLQVVHVHVTEREHVEPN